MRGLVTKQDFEDFLAQYLPESVSNYNLAMSNRSSQFDPNEKKGKY